MYRLNFDGELIELADLSQLWKEIRHIIVNKDFKKITIEYVDA